MMKFDAQSPIRSIGDEIAYCDTSEERILEILTRVTDRSDGSDELTAEIDDWPTRYHCSSQRSNLLRPFKIQPGMKVLEIGAGTGALTRYLAEQGAQVTAIEGTRARAASVVARCRDLQSVEVLCGDFNNFVPTEEFDVVAVVGVLEYAASKAGGQSTPASFLDRVSSCLAPHGILILAIENQLGLKYLLGGKEDHLGTAWVGIEDYPGNHGVRTWGRRTLSSMLDACGLTQQRWMFPFPDYKTPSSIATETAYESSQVSTLIDQWTSPPIVDHAHPERPLRDDRAAHSVLLAEDLGPDVANSFLVAAARTYGDIEHFVDTSILLYHFGGDRRRTRRRMTTLGRRDGNSLWVHSQRVFPDTGPTDGTWVAFNPGRDQAYVEGRNMEQEFLDACRRDSADEALEILDDWWNNLVALETSLPISPDACHPFLSASTTATLGPDYLDAQPSNFIRTSDGFAFIDREWVAEPAVDADLVRLRALWYLARTLVISGTPLPWPDETTVQSLAGLWMNRWVAAPDEATFSGFYKAEAALQSEVSGGDPEAIKSALRDHGQLSRTKVLAGGAPGHGASQVESRQALISGLEKAMEEAAQYQTSLESQLKEAEIYRVTLEDQIKSKQDQASEVAQYQASLEDEIKAQRNRAEVTEGHHQAAQDTIESLELEARKASGHIVQLEERIGEAAGHIEKIEGTLHTYRNMVSDFDDAIHSKDATITDLGNQVANTEITLGQVRARLAEAEAWRREFERRPLVRLYRRLRWWLPQ